MLSQMPSASVLHAASAWGGWVLTLTGFSMPSPCRQELCEVFFFFSPFTCFWKQVPSTFYAFRQQLPPEAQRWKTKSSPVQGEAEVEHRLLRREHGRHPAHPVAEGKSPGAALLLESQTCSASSHTGKESSGQFSPMARPARAAWSTRQSLASKRSFHLAASVLRVSIS